MTIADFKEKIDVMFPCRWEDDFRQDINATFNKYISIVSDLDDIKPCVLSDIRTLCDKIIKVLNLYYDGRKSDAFMLFSSIMNGEAEEKGLFSSIGGIIINPNELYYRARERKNGENFSIQDMFHIPLNKRGLVSTQRYSSLGYPCLYLGNSVYSCWEELRRLPFDNLMFSAYKVRYAFKVFDMRIPNDSDYYTEKLDQTIRRLPLVLACSFIVRKSSDVFKPEYVIPQMFVETIICNNRRITQIQKSPIDLNVIWGVIYTSTHVSNDFPYGKPFMENIVLPVIQSNNPSNYCYCLASLFDISQPLCYEYESMKDYAFRMFKKGDKKKTDEEKIKEQYEQSKMGYLEEKLKNAHFGTLNHIVIDCPDEGIVLDSEGTPVSLNIRSNVNYTIS